MILTQSKALIYMFQQCVVFGTGCFQISQHSTIKYHVQISTINDNENNNTNNYDEQKIKFERNKGKIKKLNKILCVAFKCQAKDIEISLNVNCISNKGHCSIKSQIN